MAAIITLTTDFGLRDGYVGAMKGAIYSVNPEAVVVDITHLAPPQDTFYAAFTLATAYAHFPSGTIHVAVVDPGVGGTRRAIALAGNDHLFVGPDNGVLSLALQVAVPASHAGDLFEAVEQPVALGRTAVELLNPQFHRSTVSSTFHGRDVFGPVAAHLSLGVAIGQLGPGVPTVLQFPAAIPQVSQDGSVHGVVMHIDNFGNAVTNIRREHVGHAAAQVQVGNTTVQGLSPTYSAGDGAMALWGSSETLEIAVKNGSAARALRLRRGVPVVVRPLAGYSSQS